MITEYQLRTRIYWLLREPASKVRDLNIHVFRQMPIVDDPGEKWLNEFPDNLRISREDALAALEEVRLRERQRVEQNRIPVLVVATERMLSESRVLKIQLETVEQAFRESVETFLGRPPDQSDLEAVIEQHVLRKADEDARLEEEGTQRLKAFYEKSRADRAAESPQDKAWREAFRPMPEQELAAEKASHRQLLRGALFSKKLDGGR